MDRITPSNIPIFLMVKILSQGVLHLWHVLYKFKGKYMIGQLKLLHHLKEVPVSVALFFGFHGDEKVNIEVGE